MVTQPDLHTLPFTCWVYGVEAASVPVGWFLDLQDGTFVYGLASSVPQPHLHCVCKHQMALSICVSLGFCSDVCN